MGILTKLVIATILISSSLLLLTDSNERHTFHQTLTTCMNFMIVVEKLLKCHQCPQKANYQCNDDLRIGLVSLLVAAAVVLILEGGVYLAILADFFWILFQNNIYFDH